MAPPGRPWEPGIDCGAGPAEGRGGGVAVRGGCAAVRGGGVAVRGGGWGNPWRAVGGAGGCPIWDNGKGAFKGDGLYDSRPGGRRAAGLLGAGLGGVLTPPAGESAGGARGVSGCEPVPKGAPNGVPEVGPEGGGNAPVICAGRSDSSGIETEAEPGGITSRFPGLRPAASDGLESPGAAFRAEAGGKIARGRSGGNVGPFSRGLGAGESAGGAAAFGFGAFFCGSQSAGFPRSRTGGLGGPPAADEFGWFSGEFMTLSVWLGVWGTRNDVPQHPAPGSHPPCISLSYQRHRRPGRVP
jgi:hypothetical protein